MGRLRVRRWLPLAPPLLLLLLLGCVYVTRTKRQLVLDTGRFAVSLCWVYRGHGIIYGPTGPRWLRRAQSQMARAYSATHQRYTHGMSLPLLPHQLELGIHW